MNKINISTLTLPGSKERYVVMQESEFEAMQDALDNAEASAIETRIAAGEETYPAELVDAILDGTNPVAAFRKWRGLTAQDLAEKANLSRPYVTEIETGKKDGSVKALKAIAGALDVDLDDLVA